MASSAPSSNSTANSSIWSRNTIFPPKHLRKRIEYSRRRQTAMVPAQSRECSEIVDDAEPKCHPTLGGGPAKRVFRRRVDTQGFEQPFKNPGIKSTASSAPAAGETPSPPIQGLDCTSTHYPQVCRR